MSLFFFCLQKKNKHPAVVHPPSQRYIELSHSAVKKEHVMGVSCPVIVGYSNNESSMLLDEDRNDRIQEVGSTKSYVMVPRPVVPCDLMCKTDKDLLTYRNTQTPSASSNDDDRSSAPELVNRRQDSDNDGNRADSDSDNIKQGTSLRVARVVMEQVVQGKKQELGRSGKEIPAKDVHVLALIKPEYFYASINNGIDKYKKSDDFVYNHTVDTYPHGKKSSSY